MLFSVSRNGQVIGQYTSAQLQQGLLDETIYRTDMVWAAGMSGWLTVAQMLETSALTNPTASFYGQGLAPFPPQAPQTSGLAIASMVLGLLSMFLFCATGVLAIIFGHIACSQINRSGGALGGKGMAITGLIFGYLCTVGIILLYAGLMILGLVARQ